MWYKEMLHKFTLQGRLVVIESHESDPAYLIVKFGRRKTRRQFNTDVIVSKSVHSLTYR